MIRAKERQRHSCCPPLLSSGQHWLRATITSSTKTRKKFIEVFRIHLAIGKGYVVNPVLVFRGICETLVQMKGLLQRRRGILVVIAHIVSAHVSDLTASNMQTSILFLSFFVIISKSYYYYYYYVITSETGHCSIIPKVSLVWFKQDFGTFVRFQIHSANLHLTG